MRPIPARVTGRIADPVEVRDQAVLACLRRDCKIHVSLRSKLDRERTDLAQRRGRIDEREGAGVQVRDRRVGNGVWSGDRDGNRSGVGCMAARDEGENQV